MRTMYDKTSNFIQRTGTLIDLAEVRRRQAPTQRDSLARRFEAEGRLPEPVEEEPAFRPEPAQYLGSSVEFSTIYKKNVAVCLRRSLFLHFLQKVFNFLAERGLT